MAKSQDSDLLEDHKFESISRWSKLISNMQFLIIKYHACEI